MVKQNPLRLRLLSNGVIAYMCLAFTWWSILLYTKNEDAYQAKVEILRLGMVAEGTYQNEATFTSSPPFKKLQKEYSRQEWMILGEAALFMLSIILGVWIINNSYSRLIRIAEHKRNFLLSITHELKSPIASAQLGLQTIQKRALSREQTEMVSINAQHELDRLKNLVDNLLLASKMEANYKPVFELENVNLLIRDFLKRMSVAYPSVEFKLTLDTENQTAEVDRSGIFSILSNLVENAIKYSDEDPEVTIRTEIRDEKWCLSVADRGVGIPEKEKSSIFNKFYRVGSEDTRKTKGTGLGLYIMKEMTNAHGGQIDVRDNKGQGTIFTVTLPRFQK
jgi:signal transduction histidine kinase